MIISGLHLYYSNHFHCLYSEELWLVGNLYHSYQRNLKNSTFFMLYKKVFRHHHEQRRRNRFCLGGLNNKKNDILWIFKFYSITPHFRHHPWSWTRLATFSLITLTLTLVKYSLAFASNFVPVSLPVVFI